MFLRPARPSPITEVMLGRNQLSVPPQDRVWRDDRRPLAKQFATQLFSEHSQSTALVIVQPRTLAQLLAKNPVLLPLVQVDQEISLREHARQANEHQLEWPEHIMHRPSLPPPAVPAELSSNPPIIRP